ncbi:nucleotidyltransferase family protein [Blastococcus saxobsidens]|uniref:Uncharacterized protein n=1 Tax=Blastococcus saxobsidens (strain DD2) TaxID=1146883 RepID=H6RMY1_BLASD|nr:nucleotidyltransferase family protein [Blastococcus saxobsidens]CCG01334.1 protein of unknown function [Blastococcus saxobsidens DD2]
MTDVGELLGSIAASGMECAQGAWPAEPLDDVAWAELLRRVRAERLPGFLVHAIGSGALAATPQQAVQAKREHLVAVGRVLGIETGALQILRQLASAGVQARVLKGPAVAQLDYPDPALRLFVDIDLIVRSDDFDRAVVALTEAGHHRRHRQPRPGFDRRFSKGTSFVVSDHLVVDLHRTFVMGPFGLWVDLVEVWRSSSTFTMGGARLQALDREVRFMHACFHAALGDVVPRLVPQRDVVQMLLDVRLDVDRVLLLARNWRAEAVVAKAVTESWRTLRLDLRPDLVVWALGYRPSRREARELALYSDSESGYARKSLGALRAVPGLRDKAAFLRALAFPDPSYVEGRYVSPRQRLTKGLFAVAGLRSRKRSS